MMKTTCSLPHPIVFVFDFSNEAMSVPEYNAASTASANPTCVSVRTIADVDGDVTIQFVQHLPERAVVFDGAISTPGKMVAIVTSHNEKLLAKSVAGVLTRVRIAVDDERHPSEIWVEAE